MMGIRYILNSKNWNRACNSRMIFASCKNWWIQLKNVLGDVDAIFVLKKFLGLLENVLNDGDYTLHF